MKTSCQLTITNIYIYIYILQILILIMQWCIICTTLLFNNSSNNAGMHYLHNLIFNNAGVQRILWLFLLHNIFNWAKRKKDKSRGFPKKIQAAKKFCLLNRQFLIIKIILPRRLSKFGPLFELLLIEITAGCTLSKLSILISCSRDYWINVSWSDYINISCAAHTRVRSPRFAPPRFVVPRIAQGGPTWVELRTSIRYRWGLNIFLNSLLMYTLVMALNAEGVGRSYLERSEM